jgi:alpha-L-fucosidase
MKKRLGVLIAAIVLMTMSSCVPDDSKQNDTKELPEKSVSQSEKQKDTALEQWQNDKLGMFVHWGAYSVNAGVWQGETCHGYYAEHLMRHFQIPLEVYKKEVVAKFNPTKFNADEWVKTLKDAGMGYMVITAKHHDGLAMFDSDVTDYNVVDATPYHHDPMMDLKKACDKQGVLFGFYYSHAQDWSDPDGVRNTWDFDGQPTDRAWVNKDTSYYKRIEKYYYRKAIPQLKELITKYDPDIIWFDTKFWGPEYLNKACVDTVLKLKPNLIINSRGAGNYRSTYKSTNDKPVEFPYVDGLWEAIPSINESYGYHKLDHTHHSAEYLIELIIKAVSKGGNMLLNVGPKGDGTIDLVDRGVLAGIGKWMDVNGEAIHGTSRSTLATQSFGEITMKGNTIYAHVFQWPYNGKLLISGLGSKVKRAYLLTNPSKDLKVKELTTNDLEIEVPNYPQEIGVAVVAIECEKINVVDKTRLLLNNVAVNTLHVVDADIEGSNIKYAGGNWRTNYLKGWNREEDSVSWDVRCNDNQKYDIYISYNADASSDGNKYVVDVDAKQFATKVVTGNNTRKMYVGRVELSKGKHKIIIKSNSEISGTELFRLTDLELLPIKNK